MCAVEGCPERGAEDAPEPRAGAYKREKLC